MMLYPKRQETYFPFSKKTFIASLKMVRLGIGIPYYKYISKVENKVLMGGGKKIVIFLKSK